MHRRLTRAHWHRLAVFVGPAEAASISRIAGVKLLSLLVVSLIFGCEGPCLENEPELSCDPLYEPTFDNLYVNTILPKCAVNGASCHSASGAQGGLVLEGVDAAYQALVGDERAIPHDVRCSELVVRTHSSADGAQMPPGAPLSPAEACAVRQWVAAGAAR